MAGQGGPLFKFFSPRLRPQAADFQAATAWGVAGTTAALWLVQPFDWIKKTFLEKGDSAK